MCKRTRDERAILLAQVARNYLARRRGLTPHDSEDIAGKVVESVLEGHLLDDLAESEDHSRLLRAIARRRMIDYLRWLKRRRATELPIGPLEEAGYEPRSERPSPEDVLEQQRRWSAVEQALRSLPDGDRRVILAYLDPANADLTSAQIAALLGLPGGAAVRQAKERAIKALRALLAEPDLFAAA